MITHKLRSLFHPEMYHGWGKKHNFFEGWYFKIVTADQEKAMAIIPGVAMDENGNQQAFIQLLDGINCTSEYLRFPIYSFSADPGKFLIHLDKNEFSAEEMVLDLPDIKGHLRFENQTPWPSKWYSPGIMGPYSFVPFMECYHGIVSMDHDITGMLEWQGKQFDFTGGRGYMEKDWGHSFPSAYVWMQSNHFSEKNISAKISVAKIPWLTGSFVGFIGGLWLQDHLISFTTYNGSKLISCDISTEQVKIIIEKKSVRLEVIAERREGTQLAAPIQGFMDGRVEESMTSRISIHLVNKKTGKSIFRDKGTSSGIEVAGKIDEIRIPNNH